MPGAQQNCCVVVVHTDNHILVRVGDDILLSACIISVKLGMKQDQLISSCSSLTKELNQAGAELCQAQAKLEVIVDVVEEAWS